MKRTGYRIIVLAFLALTSIQIAAGQSPAWEPQRTWVFMVGMLEWKDSESFESFPKENRRDVVLLDVLKKRGVPPDQIVYLQDKVATTIRINTEFVRLLGRAHQGDTIFVY